MSSLDQLEAFVAAAEQGSFSAAARRLGKVQSAVSNAVSNLEIETGVQLFDRSSRSPQLTAEGEALLSSARAVLSSQRAFMARAGTLNAGTETKLCIAIEQSVSIQPLLGLLVEFERQFPYIELELLDPGTNDVAVLVRENRADIGLMMEQEHYPQGFMFRGIGHSRLLPVCSRQHPLAKLGPVSHADLRGHRQLITRSRSLEDSSHTRYQLSPQCWFAESPYIILELLVAGLGWSVLPEAVVTDKLAGGELVQLQLAYQPVAALQGVDVVWTETRPLGSGGQWLLERLFELRFDQS